MRRIITSLVLKASCLICFSAIAIDKAMTNPTWSLLLYGALMMAYLLMTLNDIRDLVKVIRVKKVAKAYTANKEG